MSHPQQPAPSDKADRPLAIGSASVAPFDGLSLWGKTLSASRKACNALRKIYWEACVPNRRVRRIRKGNAAQRFLRPYVEAALCQGTHAAACATKKPLADLPVWQFWSQGLDERPALVKACMQSVATYTEGRPLRVLTHKSLDDYANIPAYIYDLHKRGRIQLAHFSDIVRTWLLCEHGGTWIDATVLLTAPLPEAITRENLFVFQSDPKADLDGLNMASYFIHAQPRQPIVRDTAVALENYWQANDFLVNYFAFLHAFTLVSTAPAHRKDWAQVPFFSFIPVQQLQRELLNPFSAQRWESLRQCSPIHKLTYKAHTLTKGKACDLSGTFYETLFGPSPLG